MEAEERPSKLRKLSHDYDALSDPAIAPTQADPEPAQRVHVKAEEDTNDDAENDDGPSPPRRTNDGNGHHQDIIKAAEATALLGGQIIHTEDAAHDAAQPVLSKNQQKKMKRRAEWEAGREDRKVKRKQKEKAKKARRRTQREEEGRRSRGNGRGSGRKQECMGMTYQRNRNRNRNRRTNPPSHQKGVTPRPQRLPIAFVIDCGYDHLMVEKEVISLGSQITRCYSDNQKAPFQAHLYISGWKPETVLRGRFEVLMKGMYKNWRGVTFVEGDWEEASRLAEGDMRGGMGGGWGGGLGGISSLPQGEGGAGEGQKGVEQQNDKNGDAATEPKPKFEVEDEDGNEDGDGDGDINISTENAARPVQNGKPQASTATRESLQAQSETVYLSSDSPYTMTELKPYHTYIIGGLVDKNRHKGICYKNALDKNDELRKKAAGSSLSLTIPAATNGSAATEDTLAPFKEIKTAKLPIGEYMMMSGRHVLATNHVLEIMLKWLETGDWGESFMEVMPKRKGGGY